MARHVLTPAERRRGLEKAIANPKTPPALKTGARKALAKRGGR